MEEESKINNDEFGNIIYKIRMERNLTQQEMADLIHVSNRTISKWEKGISVPDLISIKQICKALNISPSSLVLNKKSKKENFTSFSRKILNFFNLKNILQLIIVLLFLTLLLFYINNHNLVTIYKLKLNNDDFYIKDSYFINTKYKNILLINNITLNRNEEYDAINVQVYTYVSGDKQIIINQDSLDNIFLDELYNYSDLLTNDVIRSMKNSLYMEITLTNDGIETKYKGAFSICKEFENNKVVYDLTNKENNIVGMNNLSNDYNTINISDRNLPNEKEIFNTSINERLIELGYTYDTTSDKYIKKDDNVIISIDINNKNINYYTNTSKKMEIIYDFGLNEIVFFNYNPDNTYNNFRYYVNQNNLLCLADTCKDYQKIVSVILDLYKEIQGVL